MHRRVGTVLLLCAAAFSTACHYLPGLHTAESPPPIVKTSADHYRPGDTGGVVVVNRGVNTIGFNSCPIQLEQLVGGAWHAAPGGIRGAENVADCSTSFLLLGAGESTETRFTLAPNVAPGTYRLRLTRVEGMQARMGADSAGARTNQFTVAP